MNENTLTANKKNVLSGQIPMNNKGNAESLSNEDLVQTMKRVQADFENYRKRTQQEMNVQYLRGKASALKEMLAYADTLDSAIAKVRDSHQKDLENLRTQLLKILSQNGVKPIQTIGKPFDPFLCECMLQGNDSSKEEDIVLEEIQKGYFFNEDVLRPAKVKVNKRENIEKKENQPENKQKTIINQPTGAI